MVRSIMPMSFLSETGDHRKIGRLCRLVDRTRCFHLAIGDLDRAAAILRDHLEAARGSAS
jgi:hypothetical protein